MKIEIWSDVMCPWCAVGKARLDTALASFSHRDAVAVRWRSFQLDPGAPRVKTGEYAALLATKYRTDRAGAQGMIDRMRDMAAEEGLDFRFDLAQPGNTFDAHRLLHLAADRGLQSALKERLFTAYLTEGRAVGDPAVLQELATEVGLDEVEVKELLAGDRYADAVRADEEAGRALGITAVPFFVLDGRVGVAGAQPARVLREALDQAWAATNA